MTIIFQDPRIKFETVKVKNENRNEHGFRLNGKGNDEMINDEQIAKEMKFEKLCASGDCSSMPAKQKMQIRVGFIS